MSIEGTVEDECMFFANADSNDALSNIYPSTFIPILKASSPSGKVVALCCGKVLLRRGTQGRLVNL
jgi:hypothetical protein